MTTRWNRRAVALTLGRSGSGATKCIPQFGDRLRAHRVRFAKSALAPHALNPLRWSHASQTFALLLCSAVMLVYVLVTPVDKAALSNDEARPQPEARSRLFSSPTLGGFGLTWGTTGKKVSLSQQMRERARMEVLVHASKTTSEAERRLRRARLRLERRSLPRKDTVRRTVSLRRTGMTMRSLARGGIEVFSDPTSTFYPSPTICRVQRACQEKTGTLVIPSYMKDHIGVLQSCGIASIRTEDKPRAGAVYADDRDLFANTLRYHMPHLASDILSLSYALSVINGSYGPSSLGRRRISPFSPLVLVQDRIRTMPPDAWSPQMITTLPFSTQVKTVGDVYPGQSGSERACFHSVIGFSSQIYWQVSPERFQHGNALVKKNDLWVRSPKHSLSEAELGATPHCPVVITVLNRRQTEQRSLVNLDEVLEEFRYLKTTEDYLHLQNASMRVEYMNTTFREQVRLMQESDIILAAHGAALANLLFARVATPVIEVLPFSMYLRRNMCNAFRGLQTSWRAHTRMREVELTFVFCFTPGVLYMIAILDGLSYITLAYYAILFERMAQTLGLHHESVVARPDTASFFECIISKNTDKDSQQVRNTTALQNLKDLWSTAAHASLEMDDHRVLETHHAEPAYSGLLGIEGMRMCARNQVLRVNAQSMADRLLQLASGVCQTHRRPGYSARVNDHGH